MIVTQIKIFFFFLNNLLIIIRVYLLANFVTNGDGEEDEENQDII